MSGTPDARTILRHLRSRTLNASRAVIQVSSVRRFSVAVIGLVSSVGVRGTANAVGSSGD